MKRLILLVLYVLAHCLHAEQDEAELLQKITKGIRDRNQGVLAGLKDLTSEKAAQLVLDAVQSKRVGGGIKARLTEIVAAWPVTAPGRKTLADWLVKHPSCDDDTFLFFASIRLLESRGLFWQLIDQAKVEPAKVKAPERIAMAALGLGQFEDNPERVVTRIGTLLHADYPHVIRASAAEALGGIRHLKAIEVLIPQVKDQAISHRVACSLYRITGGYFDKEPDKQWADWLMLNREKIDFKMYPATDFEEFLKAEALVKPVDESMIDMESFYGVKVEGDGLLFILDVSGSMTIGSRIHKLRAQMSNILLVLPNRPERLRYGILTFSDDVDSCFTRGISLNDDSSRKKAGRFVEGLQADGGTSMVAALMHAATKVLPDANLDTIYLLSDGSPSDGSDEMVLDAARKIKQRHQCRIHTIAIGEDIPVVGDQKSLMEQVATLTGGTFTRVKDVE
ncbi:MAG: VWA domain-containing protein [Prosthecobacter sp.]